MGCLIGLPAGTSYTAPTIIPIGIAVASRACGSPLHRKEWGTAWFLFACSPRHRLQSRHSQYSRTAYDTILSTCHTCAQTYEVMIWFGVYGGISALSDNRYPLKPVHIPIVGGVPFNSIRGTNRNVTVYSFVAKTNPVTSYNGDLVPFYRYIPTKYSMSGGQYCRLCRRGGRFYGEWGENDDEWV
ncbi:MAG: hypothetical protein Q9215_003368 [Flavoplaca cf. flavocitrina]